VNNNGKIYVVGIGPGDVEHLTGKAIEVIKESDVVIGYKTYINLIKGLLVGKEVYSLGMKKEILRCQISLDHASDGKKVALISSGDAGVYGMAGIMLQLKEQKNSNIPVEVIPGITAASAAASILGAPLTHDFAVISLSDLLTDWDLIKKRIELAAMGDFVICFYNPKSKARSHQIEDAKEIIFKYRAASTPVGIVKNAKRKDEEVYVTDLEHMLDYPIDMVTVIVVGNSCSYAKDGFIITPRGYSI